MTDLVRSFSERFGLPARAISIGAAVVALSLLLLLVGVVRLIVADDSPLSATAAGNQDGRFIALQPGVVEAVGGPVTVSATTADASQSVVVAAARESDMKAFFGSAAGVSVSQFGSDSSQLSGQTIGTPGAPENLPGADRDIWAESAAGQGAATLQLTPRPGRWVIVGYVPGAAGGPSALTVSWPDASRSTGATPWLVSGASLLLLACGAGLWWLMMGRKQFGPASAHLRARHATDNHLPQPVKVDGAPWLLKLRTLFGLVPLVRDEPVPPAPVTQPDPGPSTVVLTKAPAPMPDLAPPGQSGGAAGRSTGGFFGKDIPLRVTPPTGQMPQTSPNVPPSGAPSRPTPPPGHAPMPPTAALDRAGARDSAPPAAYWAGGSTGQAGGPGQSVAAPSDWAGAQADWSWQTGSPTAEGPEAPKGQGDEAQRGTKRRGWRGRGA